MRSNDSFNFPLGLIKYITVTGVIAMVTWVSYCYGYLGEAQQSQEQRYNSAYNITAL